MMKFDEITGEGQILAIYQKNQISDGEDIRFEFKGASDGIKVSKGDKENLAKEICAFSNTYGGIICYHGRSQEREVAPFTENFITDNFKSIESWLLDCLEPRLLGVQMKEIDNLFIIGVPQSGTKPHRTAKGKDYFYRSATSSILMPEIMISSMYRSQSFLAFESKIDLQADTERIRVRICVNNISNLAGTNPRFQCTFFGIKGSTTLRLKRTYTSIAQGPVKFVSAHKDFRVLIHLTTSISFAKQVLYPKDFLDLIIELEPNSETAAVRPFLIRLDTMFVQSKRHSRFFLCDLRENPSVVRSLEGEAEAFQAFKEY